MGRSLDWFNWSFHFSLSLFLFGPTIFFDNQFPVLIAPDTMTLQSYCWANRIIIQRDGAGIHLDFARLMKNQGQRVFAKLTIRGVGMASAITVFGVNVFSRYSISKLFQNSVLVVRAIGPNDFSLPNSFNPGTLIKAVFQPRDKPLPPP